MTDYITDYPKRGRLVNEFKDEKTGLQLTVLHFEMAGDYAVFRGPASPEFFDRGPHTSHNVYSKPHTTVFKKQFDGPHVVEESLAYTNPDYSANRSYGPFYVIMLEDDTYYFCIQGIIPFQPLETSTQHIKPGDTINTKGFIGWNMVILKSNLNHAEFGRLYYIATPRELQAVEEEAIVCFARLK